MRTHFGTASSALPRFAFHEDSFDPLAALLPAGNPRYLRGDSIVRDLGRIGATDRVLVLGGARSG